jgi:hypothetical protein
MGEDDDDEDFDPDEEVGGWVGGWAATGQHSGTRAHPALLILNRLTDGDQTAGTDTVLEASLLPSEASTHCCSLCSCQGGPAFPLGFGVDDDDDDDENDEDEDEDDEGEDEDSEEGGGNRGYIPSTSSSWRDAQPYVQLLECHVQR